MKYSLSALVLTACLPVLSQPIARLTTAKMGIGPTVICEISLEQEKGTATVRRTLGALEVTDTVEFTVVKGQLDEVAVLKAKYKEEVRPTYPHDGAIITTGEIFDRVDGKWKPLTKNGLGATGKREGIHAESLQGLLFTYCK